MICSARITDYLRSLEPEGDPLLEEIAGKAKEDFVPIIRKETGSLLKTLVAAANPGSILELGTAVGYSALLMASVMGRGCHILLPSNRMKGGSRPQRGIFPGRGGIRRLPFWKGMRGS